jgi:hypothetical protein
MFLAAELVSVLGPERYRAEVERPQEDVRAAQREAGEALRANLVLGQAGSRTPEQLVADWHTLTMNEKRAVVRGYIARVMLTKADRSAGAGSQSASELRSTGSANRPPRPTSFAGM